MTHKLKTWPQYYCRVADGSKTFEVRNNDRGFQPGDTVVLQEWDPTKRKISSMGGDYEEPNGYTNKELQFKIGYVYPLAENLVVFALLPKDN